MVASNVVSLARQSQGGGLYFRVRYNEHPGFASLLAERRLAADGLIFDARHHHRHEALRRDAAAESIARWLDPQSMELALPGAQSKGHAELPWATTKLHEPDDFTGSAINSYARKLAEFATAGDYSAVFAPTHYVAEEGSAWLEIDTDLVEALRAELTKAHGSDIEIVYPVATSSRLILDASFRSALVRTLRRLPIDAVSLRVHPFGHHSGPLAIRRFIEASRDLRLVERPLMIERAGFAGLAAYALGTVDRIASGVTYGDRFDVGTLLKLPSNSKTTFSPPQQVYVEALGTTVEIKTAQTLLDSPQGKLWFGCKDRHCCQSGPRSMTDDPFRHSALARQRQYTELAHVPASLRAGHFIDRMAGRFADMLSRASEIDDRFKKAHHRMLSVKDTLIHLHREHEQTRRRATRPAPSVDTRIAQILPLPPRDPMGR